MEYVCNTVQQLNKNLGKSYQAGDVFICSDEVFDYLKKYQPERSKREDVLKECEEMGHVNTWFPKNQTLCMRCGALNSMEK